MTLVPGTRLGPYEILGAAGRGGMGEVYRSRDTRLDRIVAIKVLTSELARQPEARHRFAREAKAVSSLNHPHICALHDVGHHDGIDFLVMDYLEGESLSTLLSRGRLPLKQVLEYGMQIADALAAAHSVGLVHRDHFGHAEIEQFCARLRDHHISWFPARICSGRRDGVADDSTGRSARNAGVRCAGAVGGQGH
jgi:hypothetical protein